jgi:hypothetical protein
VTAHHCVPCSCQNVAGAGSRARPAAASAGSSTTQCLVYELLTNGNLEERLLRRVSRLRGCCARHAWGALLLPCRAGVPHPAHVSQ